MRQKSKSLDVEFDITFDGDEVRVYLEGTDVTNEVKRLMGSEDFKDLRKDFFSYSPERYDIERDEQLMGAQQ